MRGAHITMPADSIDKQVAFLTEIDRLKSVDRATTLADGTRRENSAEHSWHVALYALVLADQARPDVDISRVIKMLLIHDLVEIDVGDVPIFGQYDADKLATEGGHSGPSYFWSTADRSSEQPPGSMERI